MGPVAFGRDFIGRYDTMKLSIPPLEEPMRYVNRSRVMAFVLLWPAIFVVAPLYAQVELPRVSPKAMVMQVIGLTKVTLVYSRPGVKGRKIWGGLVPYGKVWRTGANEATTIEFSDDVTLNGHPVKAGKYALFTIPNPNEWTVILNSQWDQWGAFNRDPKKDILRFKVKPRTGSHVEWMRFTFENLTPESADVVLAWEKLRVPFTIKVNVEAKVMKECSAAIEALKPGDWRTPASCANYFVGIGKHLDKAMAWVNRSIDVKPEAFNRYVKAKILAARGQRTEALALAKKARAEALKANPGANVQFLDALIESLSKGKKP